MAGTIVTKRFEFVRGRYVVPGELFERKILPSMVKRIWRILDGSSDGRDQIFNLRSQFVYSPFCCFAPLRASLFLSLESGRIPDLRRASGLVQKLEGANQPGLSMLQTEAGRYRRFYQKVLTLVCVATMPLSLFVAGSIVEIFPA